MTNLPLDSGPRPRSRGLGTLFVATAMGVLMLAGCGDKKKDKAASQTAAKVNKEEITVHQINYLLSQQRGLAPAQAASASRQVLERLIDQELTLQKANDQKLDRDARVVQQIEAARREIISRAYVEKISEGAPKPTPQEVTAYYEANPALFSDRRIYNLQEVTIEAAPESLDSLKKALADAKSFPEFVAYLKTNNIHFKGNEAVRAAEQLPLAGIEQFAKLKDGQAVFMPRPGGAEVINLAGSRSQPVTQQQAVPAIEQFLLNERKRKLVADDLAALRGAAKIEYVGDFAADAARSPYVAPSAPELAPLTTIAPTLPAASAAVATPQIDAPATEVRSASMPSDSILDKGLKGLK